MQNFCGLKVSDELYEFLFRELYIRLEFQKRTEIWKSDANRKERSINYLSIKDGMISYIDITKYNITPDIDPFSSEYDSKRILTTPGRIFIKIFPDVFRDISPRFVEAFSNSFKAYVNRNNVDIKVVSGNDIKRFYRQESYADGTGSLNKSCMRSSTAQSFLDIYVDNCKMLVAFKENKVISRALLWEDVTCIVDNVQSKINFMDRVYVTKDSDLSHLINWARDNNFAYKKFQNYENKDEIIIDGQVKKATLFFRINNLENYVRYPYIDTFSYNLYKTDFLTNQRYVKPIKNGRYIAPYKFFTSTDGRSGSVGEEWSGYVAPRTRFSTEEYHEYLDWINRTLGYSYPSNFEEIRKKREEEELERRKKREEEELERRKKEKKLGDPNTIQGRILRLERYMDTLVDFFRTVRVLEYSQRFIPITMTENKISLDREIQEVGAAIQYLKILGRSNPEVILEPLEGDLDKLCSLYRNQRYWYSSFDPSGSQFFGPSYRNHMVTHEVLPMIHKNSKEIKEIISLMRGNNGEKPLYLVKE